MRWAARMKPWTSEAMPAGVALGMSRTTINRQEAMTASAIPTPLVFCGVVVSEAVMAGSPVNGTVH